MHNNIKCELLNEIYFKVWLFSEIGDNYLEEMIA